MARIRHAIVKTLKWAAGAAGLLIGLSCVPIGYIELACRGQLTPQPYRSLIEDPAFRRREANTYLTYPEWHIVYAYDGLAEVLTRNDEYAFDYYSSVRGFWSATCALMRVADEHGGADFGTRSMIHTIGVSFTLEMAVKAAYEETVGRATAWLRGATKTPQDETVARMAVDYAAFLRQTPWYQYPFTREARALWTAPIDGFLRGWERRVGIGIEFVAKAAYARLLASAAATAPAPLVIHSIVSGLDAAALTDIPDVRIVGPRQGGVEIETPRYDLFTQILSAIARRGGTIVEIAGNDDIMVSLVVPAGTEMRLAHGDEILRLARSGFSGERFLVDVKVHDLAALLNNFPLGYSRLEHVFDY